MEVQGNVRSIDLVTSVIWTGEFLFDLFIGSSDFLFTLLADEFFVFFKEVLC